MIISAAFHESNPRLRVIGVVIGLGLLLLLGALWRVQVLNAAAYGTREQAQSLRRIRIPSPRGEIVDRNGVVLANNRPSYDVVLYLEQLNRRSKKQDIVQVANATLTPLSQRMQLTADLSEPTLRAHYHRRRPLPLTVWRDLNPTQVAMFEERASNLPGADLMWTPVRSYPQGSLAAHVLGFVGRAEQNPDDEVEEFYYYQADSVGKQGVERACDESLHGTPGGVTIRVSPGGSKVGVVGEKPATRGDRIVLTLDARIQRIVEEAMSRVVLSAGKEVRGAAVVLDPRTGEVLAMASLPTFNPAMFNPGGPAEQVQAVFADKRSPMLNRATGARYAPGSTFKPVTLLAGLESGAVSAHDTTTCTGSIQIGKWPRPFRCWDAKGHGTVDALGAMKHSCDIWFYLRGMATGVDAISKTAMELGLGTATGWDLGRDLHGLVPTPDWKRVKIGEGWRDGDTAQLAIGQSFLEVTPLQMACVTATLANGGTLWRPFVVKRVESASGELVRETKREETRPRLTATPEHLQFVRQSMLGAVQAADGTGHHAAVRGLTVAGKTGTAEADVVTDGVRKRIKRAWFIGFAPYEQPQIAVALLFEDGDSGGHTAAPVAGRIFAGVFGKTLEAATPQVGYAD